MKSATVGEWQCRLARASGEEQKREIQICIAAATASGNGSVEERLLRLMVWVGTYLTSHAAHSRERDPWKILFSRDAWCDQQVIVFLMLAGVLHECPGRALSIYHCDGSNGHTVCEVHYDGGWHLYDVHSEHQSVYRDDTRRILSYEELCRDRHAIELEDHWWRGANGVGKEGFYMNARLPMICPVDWTRRSI